MNGANRRIANSYSQAAVQDRMRVVESAQSRAVLRSDVQDGLVLTGEYSLDGDTLRLAHTIENVSGEQAVVTPATHPEWSFQTFGEHATVQFRKGDRAWRREALNPDGRNHRDVPFAADAMPVGAWRLVSSEHNVAVTEAFDPAAVQCTKLIFNRRLRAIYLELYFLRRMLAPRQGRHVETSWTIGPAER